VKKDNLKAYIYSMIAITLFSTIEIVGKLIGNTMTPYAITAWRFIIGGLFIMPFAWYECKQDNIKLSFKIIIRIYIAGIINVCISMLFLQLAIYYGKAGLSAIIVSMNPLFVLLLAWVFLKDKISNTQIFGVLMGLTGLLLIIYGDLVSISSSRNLGIGILFGILAAVTFAIYTVYSKQLISNHGHLTTLSLSFLSGGVTLLMFSMLSGESVSIHMSAKTILLLFYLSAGVTGLAYILYFKSISIIGATNASISFFIKPALASILAWSLNNEYLKMIQIIGIAIIMVSLSRDLIKNLFRNAI